MLDEDAGIGERAASGIEMRVPHMPRMRHMRPNLQSDGDIGRAGRCGEADGVGEQSLSGADLDEDGGKSLEF